MLRDLLELCGWTRKELEREMPRVEKAFEMLGLTFEDIERGERRIRRFYDVQLEGVRKSLGVYIRELIDLVLAAEEGKTIIHGTIPMTAAELLTAAVLHSDKVLVAFPDLICIDTLGAIFGKFDHVMEAAERLWQSPGGAHCSLIKAHVGLYALNLIPRPDLFLAIGRTCDEEPKADEMMQEFFGIPVQYINLCQDLWEPQDFPRGIDFLTEQLDRCQRRIEQVVGFEITEELLVESERLREELLSTVRKGRDLMLQSDPMPLNTSSWDLFRLFAMKPLSRSNLEVATEAASILFRELEQRINQGVGALPKGAPRLLIPGGIHDLDLVYLLERELGLALAIAETSLYGPDGGFSAKLDKEGKSINQITAEKAIWRSNTGVLPVRINALIEACKRHHIDGVLWLYHHPCRATMGDTMLIKDAVEKNLGIPFMVLEYDFFDPRFRPAPQLSDRLESFAEMLKSAKATKA